MIASKTFNPVPFHHYDYMALRGLRFTRNDRGPDFLNILKHIKMKSIVI